MIYRHRKHKLRSRSKHAAAVVGQDSIADGMRDVKAFDGVDGGKNSFAAYGGGGDGSGVWEVGPGTRAADHSSRVSGTFTNELHGEGKSGREELA